MLIGIVGAPNKGKSTLFSALTLLEAEIADYPFTTINPNIGVTYVTHDCVEKELKTKCRPRNSLCINGIRQLPINVIDVAGLVSGAHLGKGMGNQFLSDLINADVLVQVVDLSGKTDMSGNKTTESDPSEEIFMIRDEMARWLAGIITKHSGALSRRGDGDKALEELLSGFRVSIEQIRSAANENFLTLSNIGWGGKDTYKFAASLLRISKPFIIAANKLDQASEEKLEALRKKTHGTAIVGCSAAVELALRKAAKAGLVDYTPGSDSFNVSGSATKEQEDALRFAASYIKANHGSGVQELVNTAVFSLLKEIVVYPVEDENKYCDSSGNVLPDAFLMPQGSTAQQLAGRIHSDIEKGMRYAVDAKTKLRLQKSYTLKDNDVIRIVSAAR